MIWVVDGKLRPTYEEQFVKCLEFAYLPIPNVRALARLSQTTGRLLKQWADRSVHVLLDFSEERPLWWLTPRQGIRSQWITRVSREQFVQALGPVTERGDLDFGGVAECFIELIREFEATGQRSRTIRTRPFYAPTLRRRRQFIRRPLKKVSPGSIWNTDC